MAQAVSRWPLNVAAWVRARVSPLGFVVDKVALAWVFFLSPLVFPCQYHSTVGSSFPKMKNNSPFIPSPIHSFIFIRGRTKGP
jgi:hypothetical protein